MPNVNHLNGSVYHMVHFKNLQSIFQLQALLSKENVTKKDIGYQSIALEDVQSLRDRISICDFSNQKYRSLHSYVPFYFAMHTPMLYVHYKNGIQDSIIIFEISRSIINKSGVLFTDGNASNQQLSRNRHETVKIVPATVAHDTCHRRYYPDGPHGLNENRSNFYLGATFLDRLKWDIINDHWFQGEERKRIMHAEVLVPDMLPLGRIQGIFVRTEPLRQAVNALISRCRLTGRIPSATCKPALFFQ